MLIMRLLFWSILCVTFITAAKLVAADRPTRSLTFRKGSSYFDPRITGRWFHSECINAVHHRVLICYPFKLKICRYDQFTLYHGKNTRFDSLSTNEIIETYRVNYKLTTFSYTAIFAHAAGFKLVWELPSGPVRIKRSISDVHEAAELVYESHGFDGRSCLMKNVCQAMEYVRHRDGVIAKILKLLMGSYGNNGSLPEDAVYCDIHVKNCPLELIGIDSFIEQ